VIQLKDDNTAELLNLSKQRLSRCEQGMATATPWVGQSGKLRNRRRVFNRQDKQVATCNQFVVDHPEVRTSTVTRHGRLVKKPARFHLMNSPGTIHKKEGEDVRLRKTEGKNMESWGSY